MKRVLLLLCFVMVSAVAYGQGFSVTDTQGKVLHLADYKGKWLLVNFWATWCPPCLRELPDLVSLYNTHKNKNLGVIGIAMEYRNPGYVKKFAQNMMITYPIVLGNNQIASQFGPPITGLPTSYLFNPQGKMVAYHVGALTQQAVESYIAKNR